MELGAGDVILAFLSLSNAKSAVVPDCTGSGVEYLQTDQRLFFQTFVSGLGLD
jgi:hypothetical protein